MRSIKVLQLLVMMVMVTVAGISSQPAPQSVAALDEFDMFAQSRTAYSLTRCVVVVLCVSLSVACVHTVGPHMLTTWCNRMPHLRTLCAVPRPLSRPIRRELGGSPPHYSNISSLLIIDLRTSSSG